MSTGRNQNKTMYFLETYRLRRSTFSRASSFFFLMTLIRIIYNGQRPRTTANGTNYVLHNAIPTRCTRPCENARIKREREPTDERLTVYCSMRFLKMAKFAIVAIVLLASVGSQSQRIIRETSTEVPGEG